jgi:hypothetical protein
VVFSSGSISIAFSSFVYICIAIGDPVIKMGGLGSSYQDGRVGIQLSRWEGRDPVIKMGRLGSSYQDGRVGNPLTGLTLPHYCACPKPGSGYSTPYVMVFLFVQGVL